jgi:hydrogenase expression/formation protein
MKSDVFHHIHAMTDVTNGGLRGDAFEMAETAGCRIIIDEQAIGSLVETHVRDMLKALEIDYLGVSLDALLIVAPPEFSEELCRVVRSAGVAMHEIGYVEKGRPESVLIIEGKESDFSPRFRESAYTPVKKVVDTSMHDFEEMKKGVLRAADFAIQKKQRVLQKLVDKKKSML